MIGSGSANYKFEAKKSTDSSSSHVRFAIKKHMEQGFERELQKYQRNNDDSELVDVDKNAFRSKPESLESLIIATKYSKKEIRNMYRNFKQICPHGFVTLKQFQSIISELFPHGKGSAKYGVYLFDAFKKRNRNHLTFDELVKGLSVLTRGSREEQLKWLFALYDHDKNGILTPLDLFRHISSVYDLLGDNCEPPVDSFTVRKHTWDVFKAWDLNREGAVTEAEFVKNCLKNAVIMDSLESFDQYSIF